MNGLIIALIFLLPNAERKPGSSISWIFQNRRFVLKDILCRMRTLETSTKCKHTPTVSDLILQALLLIH